MDQQQRPDGQDERPARSRRVVLRGIAWAGVTVASLTAARPSSAALQDATPEATPTIQPFVGETFVGATSDPNAFLAIVVAEAAANGTRREARAYLCNGADLAEWFDQGGVTGEGTGQLELGAPNGARLVGELTTEAARGTITLPDDASLSFELKLATGADGLYSFVLTRDGRVQGGSAGGARLEGRLLVAGTISLPDGETSDFEWPAAIDDTAEVRNILWAEAGARGAGETRKGSQVKIEW